MIPLTPFLKVMMSGGCSHHYCYNTYRYLRYLLGTTNHLTNAQYENEG